MSAAPIISKAVGNWETSFTSDNKMIHSFGGGYNVVADMSTYTAYKMKDGIVKEQFSIKGMLLETWVQILINFEKAVK